MHLHLLKVKHPIEVEGTHRQVVTAIGATALVSVTDRDLKGLFSFFCKSSLIIHNRIWGHSLQHRKKKLAPEMSPTS